MAQEVTPFAGANTPSANIVNKSNDTGNWFLNWLNDMGSRFMHQQTAMTNDYMRGTFNTQQLLGGNPDPIAQTLKDTAGDIGSDVIADEDGNNYNPLDPSGTSQAEWDLQKTRELLEEQRAYNSAEAEKNRQWQERMSSTAYQRAVEDLEKAGLNKWLAVTGGNGASASTPSGATASSSSGDAATPSPEIYKAILQAITSLTSSAMKIIDLI